MTLYWPPFEYVDDLVDRRPPRRERLTELALVRPRRRRRWLVLR